MCWIGLAALIVYKTNFARQLWENENISELFMNLTLVCLGINMSIMMYVTLIMPLRGLEPDIDKVPNLIPVLSLSGVLMPVFLTLAVWPIWGFLTPIYIFILCMGYLFSMTFLPNGKCGTLIFWVLTVAGATLSHKLPHEGHEHSW